MIKAIFIIDEDDGCYLCDSCANWHADNRGMSGLSAWIADINDGNPMCLHCHDSLWPDGED